MATTYLRIQAIGGTISLSLWVENEIMRSTGDMIRPMVVMFTVIVLNGIFDWFFILGSFGFPRLEVAGVALASASSAAIGSIMNFLILAKGFSLIKIRLKTWRDFKINLRVFKNISRIASFESAELLGRVAVEFIILRCVAVWGTAALAVYGIGRRLFKMSSMAGIDLGKTTAIMVANNLGAGNIKRAEKSAWLNIGFNLLIMGSAGLFFFIFAEKVMNFYSRDAAVVKLGVSYLKIAAVSYIFMAGTTILRRAFAGAKNTKTPAIVTVLTWGLIQIILAIYLPKIFNLGAVGVWWAISIAAILNGSVLTILFKFKPNLWQKS